ncbi:MAG: Rieske (2Fe-2S) protein [Flavobacteriales bacterium]|nr:Rieske (2Fe-2S) protein [Flavobacteriales bacterium]
MNRRDFLHHACQACAALAVIPIAASLEGCATSAKAFAVKDGVLELTTDELDKSGRTVVKADGLANKLIIVKRADGNYTALELNCPHKNGPLKEKGGMLECEWHGSTFDFDGQVTKGPSKSGLKSYPVEVVRYGLRVRVA